MEFELTFEDKIAKIISSSLESLGYELVRVRMVGDVKKSLQIMIDKSDGGNVGVDDCQAASRQISATLDVEDIIKERYILEVSSPGIDRPLTRLKDFEKYKGLEAKIETLNKVDGQRKFRGRLQGIEENLVLIESNIYDIDSSDELKLFKIDFDNVKSAKLVLNDELLSMKKN